MPLHRPAAKGLTAFCNQYERTGARPSGPVRLSSHGLFSQNRRHMATPFTPSREDVERYRRLRALSMDLNHRIIKTIPRRAYYEVGDAIGILRNGVLEFENEDMTSVLMDCCLYDWFQGGKSVVERYLETHPWFEPQRPGRRCGLRHSDHTPG